MKLKVIKNKYDFYPWEIRCPCCPPSFGLRNHWVNNPTGLDSWEVAMREARVHVNYHLRQLKRESK